MPRARTLGKFARSYAREAPGKLKWNAFSKNRGVPLENCKQPLAYFFPFILFF